MMNVATDETTVRGRTIGSFIGAAVGDVLGAPKVRGIGGAFVPASIWTDSTSMAIMAAEELVGGPVGEQVVAGCRDDVAILDAVARRWHMLSRSACNPDLTTSSVLSYAREFAQDEGYGAPRAVHMQRAAAHYYSAHSQSGGNGALMRTHVVALAHAYSSHQSTAEAARRLHSLTHRDEDAGDATVLWTLAIQHAYREGRANPRDWLNFIAPERVDLWRQRIAEAELSPPEKFTQVDTAVHAFQAAWSAIYRSGATAPDSRAARTRAFREAVAMVAGTGHSNAAVGSIVGALAGAIYGFDAIDIHWVDSLNGSMGKCGIDLVVLADRVLSGQPRPTVANGWSPKYVVMEGQSGARSRSHLELLLDQHAENANISRVRVRQVCR